ncbi:Crp/Fnr family transcriptional regulator [Sphingomonas oryzagri]
MNQVIARTLDGHDQSQAECKVGASLAPNAAVPCRRCLVRHGSICGSLEDSELTMLHAIGARRRVASGETLAWTGQDVSSCANLLSGMLKLSTVTPDGREQIVGLLGAGDFVGQPFAERTTFTITALSEAEICVFPRRAFLELVESHAGLAAALLRRTFQALEEARGRMVQLGRQSAQERVAGFLLEMIRRPGGCRVTPTGPITFDMPLSRGAMADVLGLTIETVSRQMTHFRNAGTIALPGGRAVTILDERRLRSIAEGP